MKELTVDNITVKAGTKVYDKEWDVKSKVTEEKTLREVLDDMDVIDDLDKVKLKLIESKNLSIEDSFIIKRGQYIPPKRKKKDDIEMLQEEGIEPLGDDLDIPFDQELTPKQQRKADRKAKRRRKKEIKKALKAMKKDDQVDTPEYRKLEDELLAIEGYSKPQDEEVSGKDMFEVAEQFNDEIKNLPKNLRILVERGVKIKRKLDNQEDRFAKRFCRMFRKDFRSRYGKGFREENYGEVFKAFVDLGSEGREEKEIVSVEDDI